VTATDGALGEITGRLYVEKYFSPESKRRMQTLVGNLLAAYRQSIDQLDWMGPETRARAQQKLATFTVKVAADKWRTIRPRGPLTTWSATRCARCGSTSSAWSGARRPDRPHQWLMTLQTVNAYNPLMNEIVFPAAILQPPFFTRRSTMP
jgi:predicted metalloendopeptidase